MPTATDPGIRAFLAEGERREAFRPHGAASWWTESIARPTRLQNRCGRPIFWSAAGASGGGGTRPFAQRLRLQHREIARAGVAAEVRDEPLLVHAFLRARRMSRPAADSFAAIAAALEGFCRG